VKNIGIDFFCGVPDSLLKNFCAYVTAHTDRRKHVITANEGNAVALAAGYHMATKKVALVYLQVGNVCLT
jgi:phosphonopyruvate decarboxylase